MRIHSDVTILADVIGPREYPGVDLGPYLAPGAFDNEYVTRLSDGRTVAMQEGLEFRRD